MLAKDQKNTRNNVSLVVWKQKQGIDVFNMGLNISFWKKFSAETIVYEARATQKQYVYFSTSQVQGTSKFESQIIKRTSSKFPEETVMKCFLIQQ